MFVQMLGGRNTTCVHPQTRRRNRLPVVVTPSNVHDSSGSTVDTFLPQDELTTDRYRVFDDEISTLPSIAEHDETGSNDASQGDQGKICYTSHNR